MASYFDIYTGEESDYKLARETAVKYINYPMIAWRLMFVEILEQLDEVDESRGQTPGKGRGEHTTLDEEMLVAIKEEKRKKAKVIEPTFTLTLDKNQIEIDSTNIETI